MRKVWLNLEISMIIKLLKAIVVFTLIFLSLNCNSRMGITPISFDKTKWLESSTVEQSINVRPGMARDLINRKTLIGKSCSDVIDLLGKPAHEYDYQGSKKLLFDVAEIYRGIDPVQIESLEVTLDENKKVMDAKIKLINIGSQ